MASKSALCYKGHISYPVKLEDESYSNSKDIITIGNTLKETDYTSMIETCRRTKCFVNKVRIDTSMLLGLSAYVSRMEVENMHPRSI